MAEQIGSIFIKLAAEIADFKNDMEKASRVLNDNVNKMQKSLKGLNAGLAAIGVVVAADRIKDLGVQLVNTADRFNQLQGRVKNSLDSINEFDSTFKKLIASSNQTGSSLDTVSQAFVRLRPAAQDLGRTNEELIKFNETFLKMGAIAGATQEEIGATMIQLSQGLASGTLRGDELRSVMEQMPKVARTIADSMGIPFRSFKEAAADGLVTSEAVFNAIIDKAKETDEAFSKLPPSVDRSMRKIQNSFALLVDQLNATTGTTDTLASAFQRFGKILDNVTEFLAKHQKEARAVFEALKSLSDVVFDVAKNLGDMANLRGVLTSMFYDTETGAVNVTKALGKLSIQILRFSRDTRLVVSDLRTLTELSGSAIGGAAIGGTATFATTGNPVLAAVGAGLGGVVGFLKGSTEAMPSADKRASQIKKDFETNRARIDKIMQGLSAGGGGFSPSGTVSGGGRTGSGGGGKSNKKVSKTVSDAERELERLKSQAESLKDSVRKPWELMRDEIAEADKLLKLHLISMETYNRVVENVGKKTDDMIKVEGLDQAMEAFMAPIEKGADSVLEDFATGLDKIKDSVSRQQDVLKSIETPQEKYLNQVGEISQLFNDGWLSIDQYTLALDNLNKEGQNSLGDLESAIFSMGTSFEQSFMQFTQTGKFAFKDMITSMLQDLSRLIFQMTVIQPLFGGAKANGGTGGIFTNMVSSLVGGLFGGGSKVKMYGSSFGPAFANGGQTPANQPFMVGERGPEIMSFDRPAYVTPNHEIGQGGGGSVVVNQTINISTGVQSTVRAEIAQLMPEIRRQSQNSVMEAISRGGRMSKAVGAKA